MRYKFKKNKGDRRRPMYPDKGDQLDAIWAYFESIGEEALPEKTKDMLDQIKKIKEEYK